MSLHVRYPCMSIRIPSSSLQKDGCPHIINEIHIVVDFAYCHQTQQEDKHALYNHDFISEAVHTLMVWAWQELHC